MAGRASPSHTTKTIRREALPRQDFVTEGAKVYLEQREEVRRGMIESMKLLDESLTSAVAMLTGLSPERIEELGGTGDWQADHGGASDAPVSR